VGAPAGNGAPVTYTRDTNPDLAITDNTPRGVIDSLTIADDFEIADLNVRVDSLTHTFVGDLTFMVKAPNGYGTDIISAIGASTDFGSGDNLTNTLIDDQAVNDLLSATESQAPYTGSWITAFNGVAWDGVVPGATHDPVGRLSRLNGTSTQGTWRVLVADQSPGDTGTLNSWSLIVTPKAFTCTPVVPTAADSTISGEITEPSGSPLAGVVIKLSGTQSRKTITDANGNYRFDNVETSGFYSVTPSLQSYHFNPEVRSFSQLGNTTNAVFTATRDAAISVRLIDTPEYFVRQHYLDFLGREPDESGFNFWSDQILSCGSDSGCRERRTINVSAAYFLSIEFQQTGGLVDGLYRASYGRMPRYAEFMPDTAVVAREVIVGRANWAQQLEANKQAFVAAWMERADFRAAYDGLSNAAYVDSLTSHTAGFNGDRSALANGLNSGALTRAAVLRQVVENEGFTRAKHNEMFVMMEYFGYLRRDPDASGYTVWLNKLNQFGGNFEQAEMVKAFIVSGEYRDRFR
jgi:subtilisin-like proprotein convertase family protein